MPDPDPAKPGFDHGKYHTMANLLASLRIAFYELGLLDQWASAVNNEFAQLLVMRTAEDADKIIAGTVAAILRGRQEMPPTPAKMN